MTQEQKDILLKDLCSRLPYGVKAEILNEEDERKQVVVSYGNICYIPELGNWWWKECKPYLFPLSSITEEQKNELREMEWSFDNSTICNIIECFGTYRAYVDHSCCSELIDWFIKNHIDYRGLIPMGLANDATGKNIY